MYNGYKKNHSIATALLTFHIRTQPIKYDDHFFQLTTLYSKIHSKECALSVIKNSLWRQKQTDIGRQSSI